MRSRAIHERHQREGNAANGKITHDAAEFRFDSAAKRGEAFGDDHRSADDHDDGRGDGDKRNGVELPREIYNELHDHRCISLMLSP
jgi:hypothetical protein